MKNIFIFLDISFQNEVTISICEAGERTSASYRLLTEVTLRAAGYTHAEDTSYRIVRALAGVQKLAHLMPHSYGMNLRYLKFLNLVEGNFHQLYFH